jgi:hypothetical protein
MSLVSKIWPPPPIPLSARRVCFLRLCCGGRTHSPGGEGDGGSTFWKTRDIGLSSYSNNLSTEELQKDEGLAELEISAHHPLIWHHGCIEWHRFQHFNYFVLSFKAKIFFPGVSSWRTHKSRAPWTIQMLSALHNVFLHRINRFGRPCLTIRSSSTMPSAFVDHA